MSTCRRYIDRMCAPPRGQVPDNLENSENLTKDL